LKIKRRKKGGHPFKDEDIKAKWNIQDKGSDDHH
jgi:hypothetical protein